MYLTRTGHGIFSGIGAIVEPFVPNFNVRRGSSGTKVFEVQALLNVFGAGLVVDGIFGPLTQAAVKAFQKANGLVQDGIVGEKTSRALQDDESRNIGQSPPTTVKPPTSGGSGVSGGLGKALGAAALLALLGYGGVKVAKKLKKRSNPRRPRARRRR